MWTRLLYIVLAEYLCCSLAAAQLGVTYDILTTSTGERMHWNQKDVYYFINNSMTPQTPTFQEVEEAIQVSFQTWQAVQAFDTYFTYLGPTQTRKSVTDRMNVVFWSDDAYELSLFGGGSFRAAASVTANDETGEISDVDIVFNSLEWWDPKLEEDVRFSWTIGVFQFPRVFDVQSFATHEIGHLIGAAHNPLDQYGNPIVQGCPTMLDGRNSETRCSGDVQSPTLGMRTLEQADFDVAITLHSLRLADLTDLASSNQSSSCPATANCNQRKLLREYSGTLHEVFESGGEVFYRRWLVGGQDWDMTIRLTQSLGVHTSPCMTNSGSNLLVVWQHTFGSVRTLRFSQSTDGGSTWSTPLVSPTFSCAEPGSLPTIAGYTGNFGFAAYRTSTDLRYAYSLNGGASWVYPAAIPNTNGNCNSPSSMIFPTYWSNKQANLLYATDVPSGSPQINYNYFEFGPNTWGSPISVSSIVPSRYLKHTNPCLGVSGSEPSGDKTMHAAWDAEDSYYPGTRVIIHREGSFRGWNGSYSLMQYQSENKPSISGVANDKAWMVYQSSSGSSVWKRYYDGTYWTGYYGTWIASGYSAQISVGSTSANYLYTQGSTSPYQIVVGTEVLSKEGQPANYARALNVVDPESGAYLSLEIGKIELALASADPLVMQLKSPDEGSGPLDIGSLVDAGESDGFVIPSSAQRLGIQISLDGSSASTLFGKSEGTISLDLVDVSSGQTVKRIWNTEVSTIEDQNEMKTIVFLDASEIPTGFKERTLKVRPAISGINELEKKILSVGHIYRGPAAGDETSKPAVQAPQEKTSSQPMMYILHDASPNPFNPSTRIAYGLPEPARIELKVFDVLGREVGILARGYMEAGTYTAQWDATVHSSGVYLARLLATDELGSVKYHGVTKLLLAK